MFLYSIYCPHDIWESGTQEQVNFDHSCYFWETNVLFLSPCHCLKSPRQHKNERDISAVYATVCWQDPEAKRWGVSRSLGRERGSHDSSWSVIRNQTRTVWLGKNYLFFISSVYSKQDDSNLLMLTRIYIKCNPSIFSGQQRKIIFLLQLLEALHILPYQHMSYVNFSLN